MKLTYDREADAAYLTLGEKIDAGEAAETVAFFDAPDRRSQVGLDYDAEGHLIGIEILSASRALAPELLGSPGQYGGGQPRLPDAGYVRYQAAEPGLRGAKTGIFGLANGLAREGRITEADHRWWLAANAWYEAAYPDPGTIDPSVYDRALHPRAQAWFKVGADHLLAKVPGYLALLNRYSVPWEEIRSHDPGTILYEDSVQVVVEPHPRRYTT